MVKKGEKESKPGFVKAFEKDQEKEREKLLKSLTVRERLMRRLEQSVIEVPFEDDLGSFNLTCRMLSDSEQKKVVRIQTKTAKIGKPEEYEAVMKEIYELLAYPKGICRDPELNLEFWRKGEFGSDVTLKIIAKVMAKTGEIIADTQSFRNK